MPDLTTYGWNEYFPATVPSARMGHAMCWDGTRVIMFGGGTSGVFGSGDNAETWEFDGTDWNQLSPASSPSARKWHTMVFDGTDIILHGGAGSPTGSAGFQDTWVFDGSDWTDVTPGGTKPTGRSRHLAAWNGSAMIIYGGQTLAAVKKDTWSWNGSAWTQLTPTHYIDDIRGLGAGAEDGRAGMPGVWDGARVLTFSGFSDAGGGGEFQSANYQESGGGTWQYASSDWTQVGPSTNPDARWGQGFCITDDDQKTIMFGGNDSFVGGVGDSFNRETWQYDGSDWDLLLNVGPSVRAAPMVWDDVNARGILFGGRSIGGTSAVTEDDTWIFSGPPATRVIHLRGISTP